MNLSESQIESINKKCREAGLENQGIFKQPYGIPVDVKEHVVYCRYETGGYRGGNCWGDRLHSYEKEAPANRFKVLDFVLAELMPNITFLQYRQIEELVHNNEEIEREYYGNSTDWKIEYIKLSELINLLETFKK